MKQLVIAVLVAALLSLGYRLAGTMNADADPSHAAPKEEAPKEPKPEYSDSTRRGPGGQAQRGT